MFTNLREWSARRKARRNYHYIMENALHSPTKAALHSLRPNSDLRRWERWQCPDHLMKFPEVIDESIPYKGLRNYWYPVMPARKLGRYQPVPFRLLGEDLVLFRSAEGAPQAVSDKCAHRGAMLSLGWVGLYQPGTITCPYHAWTYDGTGQCVAALTDGPDSPIRGKVRIRSYPVEEKHHLIWVYMGNSEQVPDLDENIPHAKEAMCGTWPWFTYWDWPVNYLNALDNHSDAVHPNFSHFECAQFLHQKRWDRVLAKDLPCGGLMVGIEGAGPPQRGPRSLNDWDHHVPGYIFFGPSPPKWPVGAIFWALPLDEGHVRIFTFTTFPKPIVQRIYLWLEHSIHWRKWGLPNNIYHCNMGPDRVTVISQGRFADRRLEKLGRTDVAVIRFRKMMEQAYLAERKNDDRDGARRVSSQTEGADLGSSSSTG